MIISSKLAGITPIVPRGRGELHALARGCWIRERRASSCRAWKIPAILEEALSWLRFSTDGQSAASASIPRWWIMKRTACLPSSSTRNRETLAVMQIENRDRDRASRGAAPRSRGWT